MMFGFSYLMVPIYNKACEIGWIDSRREAEQIAKNTQVDAARWIRVEFVANVNEQLPWKFEPLQPSVKIHPGQLTHIAYRVTNLTDRDMVAIRRAADLVDDACNALSTEGLLTPTLEALARFIVERRS